MALDEEKIVWKIAVQGASPDEVENAVQATTDGLRAGAATAYSQLKKAHADHLKATTDEERKAAKERIKIEQDSLRVFQKVMNEREAAHKRERSSFRNMLQDIKNVMHIHQMAGSTIGKIWRGLKDAFQEAAKALKETGREGTVAFQSFDGAIRNAQSAYNEFVVFALANPIGSAVAESVGGILDDARFLLLQLNNAMGTTSRTTAQRHAADGAAFLASRRGVVGGEMQPIGYSTEQRQMQLDNNMRAQGYTKNPDGSWSPPTKKGKGGRGGIGSDASRNFFADLEGRGSYEGDPLDQISRFGGAGYAEPSGEEPSSGLFGRATEGALGEDQFLKQITEQLEALDRELSSFDFTDQFNELTDAARAFGEAFGTSLAVAVSGTGSFKKALAEQTKAIAIQLSSRSYIKMLEELAMGFSAAADPLTAALAPGHFAAAGKWALVGTAAGLAARAIPTGGGSGAGGGSARSASGAGFSSPRRESSSSDGQRENVTFNITAYPGGEAEAGRQVAKALEAYRSKYGARAN